MDDPQNVNWVVKNDLCISCGACKVVCPRKAIKMAYNDDSGIIFPIIDKNMCNGCGICLDVCYGYKVDDKLDLRIFNRSQNSIFGNYIGSYIGFAEDKKLRFNSTSGGVVTKLLMHALDEKLIDGAIVTKMETCNTPRAKAFIATTAEEILLATGSKYCPVSFADCLEAVENEKRYAVVGLPCHIYGIRKLAEYNPIIRNTICLYIGILCGGMPSYLGTQYLRKVYGMAKQHITRLEYRGGGWPGRLLIQSDSSGQRKEISVSYPEYWQSTFGYFLPFRCTICNDGFNEFSDLSCGDAWLPSLTKNDKDGTSLIITRTENGKRLLRDAIQKGLIQITTIDKQDLSRSQKGVIQFKSLTLKSRIKLSKMIRKKIPIFDLNRVPTANFTNYWPTIDLYIGRTMASKKTLWWLLEKYIASKIMIRGFTRRLKKRKT